MPCTPGARKGRRCPRRFPRGVGRLRLRVTVVLDKWQEPARSLRRGGTEPGLQPCRFLFETIILRWARTTNHKTNRKQNAATLPPVKEHILKIKTNII